MLMIILYIYIYIYIYIYNYRERDREAHIDLFGLLFASVREIQVRVFMHIDSVWLASQSRSRAAPGAPSPRTERV